KQNNVKSILNMDAKFQRALDHHLVKRRISTIVHAISRKDLATITSCLSETVNYCIGDSDIEYDIPNKTFLERLFPRILCVDDIHFMVTNHVIDFGTVEPGQRILMSANPTVLDYNVAECVSKYRISYLLHPG